MCSGNLGILISTYVNFYSFRNHSCKSTASQGLDQESNSIGSPHSPEAAALRLTADISNKGVDIPTPDKNNSPSQTIHASSFDIRFNPDIFSPGAWVMSTILIFL